FTTALFARMRQLARAHPDRFVVVSTVAEARAATCPAAIAARASATVETTAKRSGCARAS
ncbi:MAG: hypothetical protein AAFV96_17430, partial [Pseudomonadota bacterium]